MKANYLFLLFVFCCGIGFAQTKEDLSPEEQERRQKNIEAGNPFKEFGYTPKIATLSKGKYLEWHDLDSIVKIGSFSFHVKKKQITGYTRIDPNDLESGLSPEVISRWLSVDPLAEEFPSWTPYHYAHNNPVRYIDPDGRSAFDVIVKGEMAEKFTEQLNAGSSLDITRDAETGKLSATGEAVTEADKTLQAAINDENITVTVNTTDGFQTEDGRDFIGGAFRGSTVNEDGTINAGQTVNPEIMGILDSYYERGYGVGAVHEVVEGYIGAQDSPGSDAALTEAGVKNYTNAHNKASNIDLRYRDNTGSGGWSDRTITLPGRTHIKTTRSYHAKKAGKAPIPLGQREIIKKKKN